MRLLIAFIAACVLMLAIVVWQLIPRTAHPEPGAPPPSRTEEAMAPSSPQTPDHANTPAAVAAVASRPVAPRLPPRMPASAPTSTVADESQPTTSWASQPDRQHAERQLALAQRSLADDPANPTALRDAAEALRVLGRWRSACRYLGELAARDPSDAAAHFEYATALMRTGQWVDAVRVLQEVVEREPDHAYALYNLAIAHQTLGHLHDARAAWDRTIELMPENPDARAHRGEVFLDLHDWSAAAADFEAVLQHEPGGVDAALNLSLALWRSGRLEDARTRVAAIVQAHPRHVPALNRMAEVCWALYRAQPQTHRAPRVEAITCARRSLEIDGDQPDLADWLAGTLEERPVP